MTRLNLDRRESGSARMVDAREYCSPESQVSLLSPRLGDAAVLISGPSRPSSANDLWLTMARVMPETRGQGRFFRGVYSWFTQRYPSRRNFLAYLNGRVTGAFTIENELNRREVNEGSPRRWTMQSEVNLYPQVDVPEDWHVDSGHVRSGNARDMGLGEFEGIRELLPLCEFSTSQATKEMRESPCMMLIRRERALVANDGGFYRGQPRSTLLLRAGLWSDMPVLQEGKFPTIPDPVNGVVHEPHFVLGSIDDAGNSVTELFMTMARDGSVRSLSWSRPALFKFRQQHPLISELLTGAGETRGQN